MFINCVEKMSLFNNWNNEVKHLDLIRIGLQSRLSASDWLVSTKAPSDFIYLCDIIDKPKRQTGDPALD